MSPIRRLIIAGAATIALATCSEPTAPPDRPPEPILVAITETSVVLNTIGSTRDLAASVTQGGVARVLPVYWWSRNDSTARVDRSGRVLARRRGNTWIYAVSDSGGIDSVRATVDPVPASIVFTGGPIAIMRQRSATLALAVLDSAGVPLFAPRLAWSATDTAIATVDLAGRVTGKSEGTTTVRAAIDLDAAIFATVTVTVTPLPLLRLPRDTVELAAGTRVWVPPVLVADSIGNAERAIVTAVVLDTTIAWAAPSFSVPTGSFGEPTLQFEGRRVGTTLVRFSAPGWQDFVAVLAVRPPQLGEVRRRSTYLAPPPYDPLGALPGMTSYLRGPGSSEVRPFEPRMVHFTSSDTSFLRMSVDSALADGIEPAIGRFLILRAGSGLIVATSPSVVPETLEVRTRDKGFYFIGTFGSDLTDRTLLIGYRDLLRIGSTAFVPTTGSQQAVTLTQRRPDVVRLPTDPVRLEWFAPQASFSLVGLSAGVDTIIASAAGHAPDTLVVRVVPPTLPRAETPDSIGFLETRAIAADPDRSDLWDGAEPITLRVTSSAPAVLQSATEYVTASASMQYAFALRQIGIGVATFTVTDTSGVHPPVVLDPIEVHRSPMRLYLPEQPSGGASLGVRQRRTIGVETTWWSGGAGANGTLRSSDTTIVRLGASAFTTLPFLLDIESGDVPGSAWITASGTGLTSDSVRVTVTRGLLDLGTGGTISLGGFSGSGTINVLVRDAAGNQRITRDSLFLKVRSSNRNRLSLADSIVVIPAGASFSGAIRYTAGQLGPAGVTVVPMQPLRANIDAGSTGYVIVPQ